VADNQDGTYTMSCGATVVTWSDGRTCEVTVVNAASFLLACPGSPVVLVEDGTDGANGTTGANGANDRETTVLGSVTGSSTGVKTYTLNAAGIAKVQSWINAPATNYGFAILDYAVSDGLDVNSSEFATVASRPKITVTYQ
jgi:hypothetical protein